MLLTLSCFHLSLRFARETLGHVGAILSWVGLVVSRFARLGGVWEKTRRRCQDERCDDGFDDETKDQQDEGRCHDEQVCRSRASSFR